MAWFRRRPLHERLALALDEWETAAAAPEPEPEPDRALEAAPAPLEREAGIHGVARRREWDAVLMATAPGVLLDHVRFVGLTGGDVLFEDDGEPGDVGPLADAVERELDPPYRAEAVRKQGATFAVGALRIELLELPGAEGSSITLTVNGGARELDVDGDRIFGGMPALERVGERVGESYVVRAERLDDDLFELRVDRL